jgi:hypothetical protein
MERVVESRLAEIEFVQVAQAKEATKETTKSVRHALEKVK